MAAGAACVGWRQVLESLPISSSNPANQSPATVLLRLSRSFVLTSGRCPGQSSAAPCDHQQQNTPLNTTSSSKSSRADLMQLQQQQQQVVLVVQHPCRAVLATWEALWVSCWGGWVALGPSMALP